jgi:hypothetical protein
MIKLPRNILLYGREADLPKPVPLRAGPLTMLFEAGDLRYVRLGEHEIIRRIYVAVRDHNWATIAMQMSDLEIDAAQDHFTITYTADHRERNIDFHWNATIQGTDDGRISFAMQGQARSTFLRNRIGFCVLHPPQCAGAPCRVVQEFGDVVEKPFPRLIAPAPKEDPFQEIREMSYRVAEGVRAQLRFEGDVFETEDQRNWIDGSYKTFCTPLRLPFPVKIEAGAEVSQRVELQVRTDRQVVAVSNQKDANRLRISRQAIPLPAIGLVLSKHSHNASQIDRLKALTLSHVRTESHLGDAAARSDYLLAADNAARIGAPLEIAVFVSKGADAQQQLEELAGWVQPDHSIAHWLIFQEGDKTTRPECLAAARKALGRRTPSAKIGGGSAVYFTELNRERPGLHGAHLLCYSVNPQVHAFDNTSLIENALAIGYTVESARALGGGRPVAITPITLRPRFNPDATGAASESTENAMPAAVDPRQMSLFGAVWTLASFKAIAESAAASATYYETVGWLGVMERDEGPPATDGFRSLPGGVFPLYHVFAAVGDFRGGEVIACQSTRPLAVTGLVLRQGDRLRIILANLTADAQQAAIEGIEEGEYQGTRLDESNVVAAIERPEAIRAEGGNRLTAAAAGAMIDLPPYGLVFLDREQRL